jgi:hypothetical protein
VLVHDQHVRVHVTRSSSVPASLRLASAKHDRDDPRCTQRTWAGDCSTAPGPAGQRLR